MYSFKEMKEDITDNWREIIFLFFLSLSIIYYLIGTGLLLPTLELEIFSSEPEHIQLFIDRGNGFIEADSFIKYVDDNTVCRLAFSIPNSKKIRLDFGDGNSNIKLQKIYIEKGTSTYNLIDSINNGFQNDLSSIIENTTINIQTIGNDPYVILSGDFLEVTNISKSQVFLFYFIIELLLIITFTLLLIFTKRKIKHINFLKLRTKNISFYWFILIAIIFSLYPMIITYDTAHYFSLAEIIGGSEQLSSWDPIRGFAFPFLLELFIIFLGENNISLLILYIALLLILFHLLNKLFIRKFNLKRPQDILLSRFVIFMIIIIDPIVFGYYHVVLTEGIAATQLTASVLIAYLLYKGIVEEKPNKEIRKYLIFFYIFIPFGWFLKQSYAFITLFPFLISLFLPAFKSKNVLKRFSKHLLFILIILIILIAGWNQIIQDARIAKSYRTSENTIEILIGDYIEQLNESPIIFGKSIIKKYLASANVFYYDQITNQIDTKLFFRGSENRLYGSYIYNYGIKNIFTLPDGLQTYVINFESKSYPPKWLNNYFTGRLTQSYMQFSLLYLILPFIFILYIYLFFFKKKDFSFELIIYGSILGNALLNMLFSPIDRYLFSGYPLLLLLFIIETSKLFRKSFTSRKLL